MKKLIVILSLTTLVFATTKAQDPQFKDGDLVFNASIGFGSVFYNGIYYNTSVPPISLSIEKGIEENFDIDEKLTLGIGGYLGYSSYRWRYAYTGGEWGYRYNTIIIGGRGVAHYPLVDKLDTYVGLMLGARIVSSSEFGNRQLGYSYTARGSGLAYSFFAGARYYISDNLALLGELGYGIAYVNIGVALKLQ